MIRSKKFVRKKTSISDGLMIITHLGESDAIHAKVFHRPDRLFVTENVCTSSSVVHMVVSIESLVAEDRESFVLSSSLKF